MGNSSVMIVEDEQITAMEVQAKLEEIGYEVPTIVDNGNAVLDYLENNDPDLVLMDIRLPGTMDGIDITEAINEQFDVPVVYVSAYSDDESLDRAKGTQPAGFLIKPITKEDLRSSIEVALGH